MYPGTFAVTTPDKPAVIRPSTGEVRTYGQLMDNSTRIANHLRGMGIPHFRVPPVRAVRRRAGGAAPWG